MNLDKIIRDNAHKAFSSKHPYEFEKAIMKESIRQSLKYAYKELDKETHTTFDDFDEGYQFGILQAKRKITRIIEDLEND